VPGGSCSVVGLAHDGAALRFPGSARTGSFGRRGGGAGQPMAAGVVMSSARPPPRSDAAPADGADFAGSPPPRTSARNTDDDAACPGLTGEALRAEQPVLRAVNLGVQVIRGAPENVAPPAVLAPLAVLERHVDSQVVPPQPQAGRPARPCGGGGGRTQRRRPSAPGFMRRFLTAAMMAPGRPRPCGGSASPARPRPAGRTGAGRISAARPAHVPLPRVTGRRGGQCLDGRPRASACSPRRSFRGRRCRYSGFRLPDRLGPNHRRPHHVISGAKYSGSGVGPVCTACRSIGPISQPMGPP